MDEPSTNYFANCHCIITFCTAHHNAFEPQPSQHHHRPEHHRCCDDGFILMRPTQTQSKRLPKTIRYPLHGHWRMVKFHSGQVHSPRRRRSGGKIVACSGRRGDTGFWQGQRVLGVPLLSVHNCFTALPVDKLTEIDSVPTTAINKMKAIPPTSPRCFQLPRRPKWEKRLPQRYIVAMTPGLKSLKLPILMQTTDTGTVLSTKGLLNCGVTDLFVNSDFIQQNNLTMKKLSWPIPVYNVDGMLNEAGSILEVWDAVLWYCDHTECTTFAVTGLGSQDIILGLNWLHEQPQSWLAIGRGKDESLPQPLLYLSEWGKCRAKNLVQH